MYLRYSNFDLPLDIVGAIARHCGNKSKTVSCSANSNVMNKLILSAFYDNVNNNVGPTLMWVFFFLLLIEFLYVCFKYLNSNDKK